MKLIIQIPCYNEAETLPQVFNELPKNLRGITSIETLLIDDGSTDKSVQVAEKFGVNHILSFKQNMGLARAFKEGLDACIKFGADIIVNTDADNQYCAKDIEKLIAPILEGSADIVIGARPIEDIKDFSWIKKKLQRFGSSVVRSLSLTDIPDATSGFRAFSRTAALRINIFSQYTYTLETLIQAGENKLKVVSIPVRVNRKTRESRLLKSIPHYIIHSVATMLRICVLYRPFHYFFTVGSIMFFAGFLLGLRFLFYYFMGTGTGHIQSLILASVLLTVGFQMFLFGLLADVVATNRKLAEDIQARVKNMELTMCVDLSPKDNPNT
ncbi:MAG: glycosyltransferase family 2 protein [Candidatus Auribacterota bacterium]|jgi:glycosyltransferase involved in cell wall biosynthesis|nr:glycosyltransferase family 2 protein [Candidatus Auribacterota bacterium]